MKLKEVIILFIFILLFSMTVNAGDLSFNIVSLEGHTTFIISGDEDGGWKSELEFPLNIEALEIEYKKGISYHNIDHFSISLLHNIFSSDAGTFTDSDWFYMFGDDKVIYSESSTDLTAWILDANIQTKNYRKEGTNDIGIAFMAGYRGNYFESDIYDSVQYNSFTGEEVEIQGKNLYYHINYYMPYFGAIINNSDSEQKLRWELMAAFSPYVSAKDYDDHILRYRILKSETSGTAAMAGLDLSYNYNDNLSVMAGMHYKNIKTIGTQTQYTYDMEVLFEDIDSEINSLQKQLYFGINYKF